jgi:hypothetical protein
LFSVTTFVVTAGLIGCAPGNNNSVTGPFCVEAEDDDDGLSSTVDDSSDVAGGCLETGLVLGIRPNNEEGIDVNMNKLMMTIATTETEETAIIADLIARKLLLLLPK